MVCHLRDTQATKKSPGVTQGKASCLAGAPRYFSDMSEPLPISDADDMRAGVDPTSLPKLFQCGIHDRPRRPDEIGEILLRDSHLQCEAMGTGFPGVFSQPQQHLGQSCRHVFKHQVCNLPLQQTLLLAQVLENPKAWRFHTRPRTPLKEQQS